MNIFKTITSKLKSTSVKTKAFVGVATMAVLLSPLALAEFYPARPTFDYNKAPVNGSTCTEADKDQYNRCGSMDGPVFNSFVNTPSYGDERAFVDARRSDQTASGSYKNVLQDVDEGSKEIVVRMYVHNNANQNTNESGLGVAKNTKVRVALPSGTSQTLRARGYITADNAATVEDTVDFVSGKEFSVEYVPGSATLYDNDNFKNGVKLADSIVGDGALIGSDQLDGNLKGCFDYEAVVQVRVKVKVANPDVEFDKQVATVGQSNWGEDVEVSPGETVKWLVSYQNTGETTFDNVTISDKLPPHVEVKPGTVKYIDAAQEEVQDDEQFFTTGGINFGTWQPNGGFYVRFDTVALDNFDGCEVSIRNVARATADQHTTTEDFADVKIVKENCGEEPEEPVYACDALEVKKLTNKNFRFTARATAENGATIKQYRFDFGDGSEELLTDKATVEHSFAKEGTYVVRLKVDFMVDGKMVTKTAQACETVINTDKEVENCPIPGKEHLPKGHPDCKEVPTTPTELPKTGPANLVGIFAAVSVAAGIAHRAVLSRRYM